MSGEKSSPVSVVSRASADQVAPLLSLYLYQMSLFHVP